MMSLLLFAAGCLLATRISAQPENEETKELEAPSLDLLAERFMKEIDVRTSEECTKSVISSWSYETNITAENQKKENSAGSSPAAWKKQAWKLVQTWKDHVPFLTDETLKRQFELWSVLGTAALSDEDRKRLKQVIQAMNTIYSTSKICDYHNPDKCDLSLNPDITKVLLSSTDYKELTHVWKEWRDISGKKMRNMYKDYVWLSNMAARLNGFANMGDMWIHSYSKDVEAFRQDMKEIYQQLKPLYEQLHAYVRRKLREVYGSDVVTEKGPIPANLMGDMWGQWWDNSFQLLAPYPNKSSVDVTETMQEQGYTVMKMFQMADDFFASLNLTRMPGAFWNHTIFEKPKDREIVCHPSAWDFCNGKDFRIKMCTEVNMRDFLTVHHEMGHIQYYIQYKDLPLVFRKGANGGFHEAVGEVLSISVGTPKHLHKIGLLENLEDDAESDINFLMKVALNKIAYIPFAYLVDLWRWNVFSGKTEEKDWNCAWWDLRYELQGLKPPVIRTEDDFDPGAKYHVPADMPYLRYFVANVIQFQFLKAMCLEAGEYDPQNSSMPLHKCDIYQSTSAGKLLGDMLKLGTSKPWEEAMAAITGQRKTDATVLREYFKPLEDWLIEDNKKHQEYIGWTSDGEYCVRSSS